MKLEISECIEVDTKKLIEEYGQLLTESSKKSIIKNNYKFKGDTKDSVIAQLKNQFESVKVISKKGRYGGTTFELKGFKGLVEYERENKGGRPSLDWTNELLVILELINQEVAWNDEQFYKGFTVSQLLNKMLGFDKYTVVAIVEDEVQNHDIFTSSGNVNDEDGLKETVNCLISNQRHIYMAKIEEELSKTNHKINYFASNRNNIDVEKYEEYMIFKKEVETKIKAENEKIRDKRTKAYREGLNIKNLPKYKNEHKEIEIAVKEKFGFKYAYRQFTVFNEIKVEGEGDIDKVRENYFNRIMKNANSSQSKYKQTEEIKYFEKPFYRLVHAGLYEEVMDSVFSKLVNFESKTESNTVDVLGNSVAEDDDEALQEHLDGLEQYVAEQRLEQEDYFYNQDDYVDVERILHEMKNPLSDEECEELYKEFFEY
ncbi:hypothetical protein [Lactococcus lactis]|uniref:hypothetical protein n=1 Tax=Lactococcus lactis TaxID=1358 RepID=UPI00286609A4|nr:hypothetical protein [Lactococcus lactis]MDR7696224.1 hypothetical protein [Lactococcus lactis]